MFQCFQIQTTFWLDRLCDLWLQQVVALIKSMPWRGVFFLWKNVPSYTYTTDAAGTRSLAQMLVAPKQCLTSMLKQAPTVKSVEMKPLVCHKPFFIILRRDVLCSTTLASLVLCKDSQPWTHEMPVKETGWSRSISHRNVSLSMLRFQDLAAPLSFITRTQGALENAVANLLNNGVGLFNKVGWENQNFLVDLKILYKRQNISI